MTNRQIRRLRLTSRLLVAGDCDIRDGSRVFNRTHGRRGTYAAGCRCDQCRDVESDYSALRKRRKRERVA